MNLIDVLRENSYLWDAFTRKEEYNPVIKDKHNRFAYYASKDRDIFEPRVSQYLIKRGFDIEYPNKTKFAVCLSHDVDGIYKEGWRKGLDTIRSMKSLNLTQSLQNIQQFRSRKMPYCNLKHIVELEERYDASSTFYFLALKPHDLDFRYDATDLTGEFEFLLEKGAEIGLHGGHYAYNSIDTLVEEKKRLEKIVGEKVFGYRNHFLKFIIPDTWEILRTAGFQHDSTLGYSDCAGFRNGMCHPFNPYNLTTNKVIDIIEIPLVIHDTTLFDGYMRLDADAAWNLTRDLINKTERNHGVISVLWHNSMFTSTIHAKFYEKILDYCKTKKAWITNAGEIASFWKNNGWMQ
jgi:peptidoglycan/xylan/chitin deacetylase (PgdA/CDA1 family)